MRRFRRSWLLAVVCVSAALTGATVAAPPPDPVAPREQVAAFFNTLVVGDAAKAFDTLLAGSSISANKPEASYNLRRQLQTGVSAYGKPLGYDLVDAKAFGTSLVRLVYILRMEKYPLTWEFFFYQGGGGWLPIDVRFSDKLDAYRYFPLPTATDGNSSS